MEQEVPQPSSDSVRDPCYAQITSDEAVNKLQKDASDNIRSGSDTDKIMAEDSKETVKAEEELNEKDITEPDEYNYTKRDDFTSEIFKLAISNLPRKFGFKVHNYYNICSPFCFICMKIFGITFSMIWFSLRPVCLFETLYVWCLSETFNHACSC